MLKFKDIKNPLFVNGEKLTDETLQATKDWFYNNAIACIEEAESGKVYVNDLAYYTELQLKEAEEYASGNFTITLTFMQRAYYIQTGKSVAMMR